MEISEIINKILSVPHAAFFYTPPIYGSSKSYLFLKPKQVVTIKSGLNIEEKLKSVDELISKGFDGYALLNYEAGYLFEKSFNKYLPKNINLIQFFFYNPEDVFEINSSKIDLTISDNFIVNNFKLNTTRKEFDKSINKIKSLIAEGDTYQVNYTVKGKFNFSGSFAGLFANLVFNQSARYTSFIKNKNKLIISLSPELFFETDLKKIISKPMKGTTQRGVDVTSDSFAEYNLRNSTKNIAENVMIVDLIRNDLGRISKYGSVKVKDIFEVQKYESVFQMISTIEGKLKRNKHLSDIIKNIFPCGSITGAPKIRTMEIIKSLEKEERCIYTGSIGLIRNRKITFNIPIRTLLIDKNTNTGEIGLGSGIVWDSSADEEYNETLLKGNFLTHPNKHFEIFETMKIENGNIKLLKHHLERMKSTADYFLFCFDATIIKDFISAIKTQNPNGTKRIKLLLSKSGSLRFEITELPVNKAEINIIISTKRISSTDKFQYFKTTNRSLYDSETKKYSTKGFFEVIYFNERNELAEGAITNIFVRKGKVIFTPPIKCGLLSGIYRKYLMNKNSMIKEKTLYLQDLIDGDEIFLTNALRGKVKVNRLFLNDNDFVTPKNF